jgi:2-iminobutanoate/2-iminopropanoate deaminase
LSKRINPDTVWKPFGAFSMLAIQGRGQIVHLKGQVSLDGAGQIVGKNEMPAQVRRVLENIRATLEPVGGQMEDIYSLTQFVTDMEAFMVCGPIRSEFFAEPFPVTTTIEVRRLYHPDLMVEITASAEIPTKRFRYPDAH